MGLKPSEEIVVLPESGPLMIKNNEGNINIDPLFTDPDNGDYTLQGGSPCIDTGIADIDGNGVVSDVQCPNDPEYDYESYQDFESFCDSR